MVSGQSESHCVWCGESFVARRRGAHVKRFCSPDCKSAYHNAARRYGELCLAQGRVSLDELKALSSSYTTEERPDSNLDARSPSEKQVASCTTSTGAAASDA